MKNLFYYLLTIIFIQTEAFSQLKSDEFLAGIKSNSLGKYIFSRQNNSNFDALSNPANFSFDTSNSVGFSTKRLGNLNQVSTAFRPKIRNANFIVGIQTIPIGKIAEYDNVGNQIGMFSSNLSNLIICYSLNKKMMSFGVANVSNLYSIQNFRNFNNYFNLSGLYDNPKIGFAIGWSINQLLLFNSSHLQNIQILPNIVFGGSIKPKYLPIRIHASMFDLIAKNYRKNFSIGSEFLVDKPFNLFLGYNNATINKLRIGLKLNKNKFSFLAGTEFGKLQTNSIEINLKLK